MIGKILYYILCGVNVYHPSYKLYLCLIAIVRINNLGPGTAKSGCCTFLYHCAQKHETLKDYQ